MPLRLTVGQPGAPVPPSGVEQSTGSDGFHLQCDIGPLWRLQSFTPGRTGQLTAIRLATFSDGQADADLVLDLVRLGADEQPEETLATSRVPASRIGRSAREVAFDLDGVQVVAGQRYGFRVDSPSVLGCYGFAYNDDSVYARGQLYSSDDQGTTWPLEAQRVLKFTTIVK